MTHYNFRVNAVRDQMPNELKTDFKGLAHAWQQPLTREDYLLKKGELIKMSSDLVANSRKTIERWVKWRTRGGTIGLKPTVI